MSDAVKLDFTEVSERIKQITFPDVDLVVGIATGGVVPASLVAFHLNKPLRLMHINYRAPDHTPHHASPILLSNVIIPSHVKKILLVDDVSVTGQSMNLAKQTLASYQIVTFVLKGKGDYVAFPAIETCVLWPWKSD